MSIAKIHVREEKGKITYIESELVFDEYGLFKKDGYLHLKCGKIPLEIIESEEIVSGATEKISDKSRVISWIDG